MSIIKFDNVSEKYRIKFVRENKISWEEIWALEGASFEIKEGEVFGIIGQNGAGKTTLLKLIAGMIIPDSGAISVAGKVATLMELGAGFNAEFTGRENIMVNARIYGLKEDVFSRTVEEIIAFADLGKFIDAPIKYYSQGMYMRLAFALAIFINPDILLIDDILAVGDTEAQHKCIKRVMELKESGKTVVVVSHDMDMICRLCDRALLLEKGKVMMQGEPEKVIATYLEASGDKRGIAVMERSGLRVIFNNGKLSISYNGIALTNKQAGYMAFLMPSNTWNFSSNLYWEAKKLPENKVLAEGKSGDGSVSQSWAIALEDDYLCIEAAIKGNFKEPHVDLMFSGQYDNWKTLHEDGVFPSFMHRTNWQDIGMTPSLGRTLALTGSAEASGLPGLVFEVADRDSKTKLLNTGMEFGCHVVQLCLNSTNSISFRMAVFPERKKLEEYLEMKRSQQEQGFGIVA